MRSNPMPLLGYGTFPLQDEEARACVLTALEIGYRHLDTAQMYRNEAAVGRGIRDSGLRRNEVFLTTKVHPDNYAEGDFETSVARSLEALDVDQVDLLLLHWPHPSLEMKAVLDRLVGALEDGQAASIGVSNFGPDDLKRAQHMTGDRLACNQIELHPFVDQQPTIRAAGDLGIGLTAYSPVAKGKVADDPTLKAIGEAHGATAAQIAIAWLLQQEIAAIPKSGNPDRIKANFEAGEIRLDEEEMRRIDAIGSRNGKLVNPPGLTPIWGRAN